MSTDKQNNENELAMAILNGLSGPNACKAADERRRMIPLHIADQAVAACEKEIAQLKAENARLRASSFVTAVPVEQYERVKAEVERLTKADGWQPMETAPFDPNIRIIICTFDNEVEITYSSDLCHYPEREYPKYWMPVPTPPKEGKQP